MKITINHNAQSVCGILCVDANKMLGRLKEIENKVKNKEIASAPEIFVEVFRGDELSDADKVLVFWHIMHSACISIDNN